MNIKEIKEMIALMNENNLSELEIEKDGFKVRLKKIGDTIQQQVLSVQPVAHIQAGEPSADITQEAASAKKLIEIKAPMVGTFYRAPSPESPPYVDVGKEIEPGQVVCIIEAMKLMNEIKSEVKGKIVEIMAESSTPVEFGQVLFLVEPT